VVADGVGADGDGVSWAQDRVSHHAEGRGTCSRLAAFLLVGSLHSALNGFHSFSAVIKSMTRPLTGAAGGIVISRPLTLLSIVASTRF